MTRRFGRLKQRQINIHMESLRVKAFDMALLDSRCRCFCWCLWGLRDWITSAMIFESQKLTFETFKKSTLLTPFRSLHVAWQISAPDVPIDKASSNSTEILEFMRNAKLWLCSKTFKEKWNLHFISKQCFKDLHNATATTKHNAVCKNQR